MSRFGSLLLSAMILLSAAVAPAADWPQYMGPARNNISVEKNLADRWGENGPPVLWTVSLGTGFTGPAVRDGRVYVLDREGNGRDILRCFNAESGEEIWSYGYDAPGKLSYDGSRQVPTVGEKNVYAIGPFGHFHCVSLETHEPVWSANLLEDFGGKRPSWGVSQSPALDGEHVIVAPLTDQASVVAYDAQTGKIAWQADPIPGALRYTSPVITEIGGVRQVVVLSNKATAGIDLRDGKILWTFTGWECKHSIPSPIMLPDGRIFLTGGYEAGSAMFRVTKGAEGFATEELYRISDIAAQIHQPIFHDGYLYLLGNSNKLTNGLVCLDLDGKVQWKTGENKFGRGNFILADGRFYIMDGKKGDLYLVKPSPTEYIELDSAPLLGGQNIWAPMALSDGRLYLRDQNEMKCIDVRQH